MNDIIENKTTENKKIEAYDILQRLAKLENRKRELAQQYQKLVSEIDEEEKDDNNNGRS